MLAYSEWLVAAMALAVLVGWGAAALWGVLTRLRRGAGGPLPDPPRRRRRRR